MIIRIKKIFVLKKSYNHPCSKSITFMFTIRAKPPMHSQFAKMNVYTIGLYTPTMTEFNAVYSAVVSLLHISLPKCLQIKIPF